jgi:hypothetical protein
MIDLHAVDWSKPHALDCAVADALDMLSRCQYCNQKPYAFAELHNSGARAVMMCGCSVVEYTMRLEDVKACGFDLKKLRKSATDLWYDLLSWQITTRN